MRGAGERIALVHDFLLDTRGAERVFEVMADMWPDADVFTAVYDEAGTEGRFAHRPIVTSPLQALRPTARTFRGLLPLYPRAIQSLDLSGYTTVVSSSSAWAHGVKVDPGAVHVCYCYNPFRYAWAERDATLAARDPVMRWVLAQVFHRWRAWDRAVAQRVDSYVACSTVTQERIADFLGRESEVLHPPVALERFAAPGRVSDYYLCVGELMAHKRVDVLIAAFNRLGRRLVVVGDGPQRRELERLAGPTVQFAGRVSDTEVARLMSGCRALVCSAEEEFGIAMVETLASGRPVIALGRGGALETVTEGVTGHFFARAERDAVVAAVRDFDADAIDPEQCRAAAQRFSEEAFRTGLSAAVARARSDAGQLVGA